MNEGLNEVSADGADAELAALDAVELIAIIEVHVERVVGGALRTAPVRTLGDQAMNPRLIELGCSRQVEISVTFRLVCPGSFSSRVSTCLLYTSPSPRD